MFCPYCGREFSERDSKYCPFCGQDLSSPDDPLIEKIRYSNIWKMKSVLIVGTVAIAVMLILLASILIDEPEPTVPDDEPIDHTPRDLVIVIDDSSQIVLGDDFDDYTLLAEMNGLKQLVITLNAEEAAKYSNYTWVLRDELSNTYMNKDKQEPQIIWPVPSVGMYSVLCYCYTDPSETEPSAVYNGSIQYQGDKTQHFTWDYRGKTFQIECMIPIADQQKYSSNDIVPRDIRHGMDMHSAWRFVVTDGAVEMLEAKLGEQFAALYGPTSPGIYSYADFLLSFVHGVGFAYDSVNHYMGDYWAFPAETLFNGCGDEEDLAFLYASLLTRAGYDCGIFFVPSTTMVAVHIDDMPSDIVIRDGCKRCEIQCGDVLYQISEPYSQEEAALGTMQECYTFDPYGIVFYYYGELCIGNYGFVSVSPSVKLD